VFGERQQRAIGGIAKILFAEGVCFRESSEVAEKWGDLSGWIGNRG